MKFLDPQPTPRAPLTETEKGEILGTLKQSEETLPTRRNQQAVETFFNVAGTAVGGILFALLLELQERERFNPSSDFRSYPKTITDTWNQNNDIAMQGIACLITLGALKLANGFVQNKFFKTTNIARSIKESVAGMTFEQIDGALLTCGDETKDLSEIKIPKSIFGVPPLRLEASYVIGSLIATTSSTPENEKYLVFTASKVLTNFFLTNLEKKFINQKKLETSLLSEEFLNDFSAEEKQELRASLTKELRKQNCGKATLDLIVDAAASFSFTNSVHYRAISAGDLKTTLAASFAVGSAASNAVHIFSQSLRDSFDKNNNSAHPARVEEIDVEIGLEVLPRAPSPSNSATGSEAKTLATKAPPEQMV